MHQSPRPQTTDKFRLLNWQRSTCLPARVTEFNRGEDGGAYTLSYVMVIPILMLIVCAIVETTLMMSAKLGTVYAAYSAARTAVVWSSASSDWNAAQEKIERAAVKSFVPFACSSSANTGKGYQGDAGRSATAAGDVDSYVQAYEAFVDAPVSVSYVRAKYRNAEEFLEVTTNGPPRQWDSDITVTVKYQFPFHVPGIGKLFGTRGADGGYYFALESQATLQNDGPQNAQQTLGIGYGILN